MIRTKHTYMAKENCTGKRKNFTNISFTDQNWLIWSRSHGHRFQNLKLRLRYVENWNYELNHSIKQSNISRMEKRWYIAVIKYNVYITTFNLVNYHLDRHFQVCGHPSLSEKGPNTKELHNIPSQEIDERYINHGSTIIYRYL